MNCRGGRASPTTTAHKLRITPHVVVAPGRAGPKSVGWVGKSGMKWKGGGKRALGFNRGPKAPGRDARSAFIRRRRQEAEARPVSKVRLEFKGGGKSPAMHEDTSRAFLPRVGGRLREGKKLRRRRLAREGSPRAIKKPPGFCHGPPEPAAAAGAGAGGCSFSQGSRRSGRPRPVLLRQLQPPALRELLGRVGG